MQENNSFIRGIRNGAPIAIGYFAVSFAFGIFAVGAGLSWLEAVLISAFNVTSAGQLAAVPIIAASGGFLELGLTQLVINLRYSLMSVTLSQKMGASVRVRDRFLIAYVNTDEVFAVASASHEPLGRKYLFGLILTPPVGWTLGTLSGAVAGNILPEILLSALGVAIYAMFIAILVPAARASKSILLIVLLSSLLSIGFSVTPKLQDIPSGFVIIIISVVLSAIFAIVAPVPDEDCEEAEKL